MSDLKNDPIINYGWRLLDRVDYCKDGDEHLAEPSAGWKPMYGTKQSCDGQHSCPIRRRIEVPAGYELVPLDEKIGEGYLIYDRDDREIRGPRGHVNWSERTPRGVVLPHIGAFFRPIKDEWIKIETRLPKPEEYPVWVACAETGRVSATEIRYADTYAVGGGMPSSSKVNFITHWKRCQLPTPPVPERSAEEIAFENWKVGRRIDDERTARDAWLGGRAYALENRGHDGK